MWETSDLPAGTKLLMESHQQNPFLWVFSSVVFPAEGKVHLSLNEHLLNTYCMPRRWASGARAWPKIDSF